MLRLPPSSHPASLSPARPPPLTRAHRLSRAPTLSAAGGRLALNGRLCVGGHSFGGCTALALAADALLEPGAEPLQLGACFTLDPAVDWVPRRLWGAVGFDGVVNDANRSEGALSLARCPLVSRGVPLLNVFSEGWQALRWYQQWAAALALSADAARPAASLTIRACGHQGLCDLASTLPDWLNKGLKNSLGAPSADMARAVNESVLAFLVEARMLDDGGRGAVELSSVAMTASHVGSVSKGKGGR